jgi:hypothetical protein
LPQADDEPISICFDVATDGGAFSGDAKARGTLVALTVKR